MAVHQILDLIILVRVQASQPIFSASQPIGSAPGGNVLSGVLGGGIGQVNGTTAHGPLGQTNLITPGAASGVNWYAVPRQAEFGAKVTF